MAEAEIRLQLQNTGSRRACLIQLTELRLRRRNLHVSDAMRRIGLTGLLCRRRRLLVLTEKEVAHRLGIIGREGPRIERT